jgi:uncharacterized protein (TIGR04255 family)
VVREVFKDAPLQIVSFEVLWEARPGQNVTSAVLDNMLTVVPDSVGNLAPEVLRIAGPLPMPQSATFQIVGQGRTVAVTLWPGALVVESSDYTYFADFIDLVRGVVQALIQEVGELAMTRVGMRYIDEIHVPGGTLEVDSWRPWVAEELLALGTLAGPERETTMYGGGVSVPLGDDCHLTFRYGITNQPQHNNATLQLRPRPDTPALILDTDGFVLHPIAQSSTTEQIIAILEQLHDPTHSMFDRVLKAECLNLFRGGNK